MAAETKVPDITTTTEDDPWEAAAERIRNTPAGQENQLDSVTVVETMGLGRAADWLERTEHAVERLQGLLANTGWIVTSAEVGALSTKFFADGPPSTVVEWDLSLEFERVV
jgi:hypothetical protein